MLDKWEKLDQHQKIIVGAVAALLIAWAGFAATTESPRKRQGGGKGAATGAVRAGKANNKGPGLEQAKKAAKAKLERAKTMTEEQYAELRKRNKNVPATLKEFVARQQTRFDELTAMRPEEWAARKGSRGTANAAAKVEQPSETMDDAGDDVKDEAAPSLKSGKADKKGRLEKAPEPSPDMDPEEE